MITNVPLLSVVSSVTPWPAHHCWLQLVLSAASVRYNWHEISCKLRWTMWWLDTCIRCITVRWVNTTFTAYAYHAVPTVTTCRIHFHSNLPGRDTVQPTRVATLDIRSPELNHLISESSYPLNNISPFLPPFLQSGGTTNLPCFYEFSAFRFVLKGWRLGSPTPPSWWCANYIILF